MTGSSRSSLRRRAPAETLLRAREVAAALGVTRVHDTTALDRFGVPVFASIRPDACRGSLCVSAGKGLTPVDAEVGAYMEAIELALAEPRRAALPRRVVAARELLDGAYADLVPARPLAPETPVVATEAEDLLRGGSHLVPLERVLFPVLHEDGGGLFGSDTNGLASGNDLEEATLHGLAETVERDAASFVFQLATDSRWVLPETLPAPIAELVSRAAAVGFDLVVRWVPSPFGFPYFIAGLHERDDPDRAHRGDGLHPHAEIALVRAVCEAFQSRLTDIHGGRDDLTFLRARDNPFDAAPAAFRRFIDALRKGDHARFDEVPDLAAAAPDVRTGTRLLLDTLARHGLDRVLRVVLSPADLGLAVVRVIVPGLENYYGHVTRRGRRLEEASARRARP